MSNNAASAFLLPESLRPYVQDPTFVEMSQTQNCGLDLGTLKISGRISIMVT